MGSSCRGHKMWALFFLQEGSQALCRFVPLRCATGPSELDCFQQAAPPPVPFFRGELPFLFLLSECSKRRWSRSFCLKRRPGWCVSDRPLDRLLPLNQTAAMQRCCGTKSSSVVEGTAVGRGFWGFYQTKMLATKLCLQAGKQEERASEWHLLKFNSRFWVELELENLEIFHLGFSMLFVSSDSMWLNLSGPGSGERLVKTKSQIPLLKRKRHACLALAVIHRWIAHIPLRHPRFYLVLSITQSGLMLSCHYQTILHCCSSPNVPFQPVSMTSELGVLSPVYKIHRTTGNIYMPPSSSKSSTPLEKPDREASQLAWPVPLLSYRRVAECAELKGSHRWAATDVKAGRGLLPGDFGWITVCYCTACLLLSSLPWLLQYHFIPLFPENCPTVSHPKSSEVIVDALPSLRVNPLTIKASFLASCAFQRRYFWPSMSRSVTQQQ